MNVKFLRGASLPATGIVDGAFYAVEGNDNVTHLYLGKTIGHKAICPLPSLCGRSITVKINGTNHPKLESIALF